MVWLSRTAIFVLVAFVVGSVLLNTGQPEPTLIALQFPTEPITDYITMDSVAVKTDWWSKYLEIRYSWLQIPEFECPLLVSFGYYESLFLSKDNQSWRELGKRVPPDISANGSGLYEVHNSPLTPFPFDVATNETIYIRIRWVLDCRIYVSDTVAYSFPVAMNRAWYFDADLTLLGAALFIFASISVVFILSRRHQRKLQAAELALPKWSRCSTRIQELVCLL